MKQSSPDANSAISAQSPSLSPQPVPYQPDSPFLATEFLSVFPLSLPEHFRSPTPTTANSPSEFINSTGTTPISDASPSLPPRESRPTVRKSRPVELSPSSRLYGSSRSRSRSLSPELRMPGAWPLDRIPRPHGLLHHRHQTRPSITSISSCSTTPAMSPSTSSHPTTSPTSISSPASFASATAASTIGPLANSTSMNQLERTTEQMRAAYSASIRKKPSRVLNRASWNPPYAGAMPSLPSAPASMLSNTLFDGSGSPPSISQRMATGADVTATPRSLSLLIPPAVTNATTTTTS